MSKAKRPRWSRAEERTLSTLVKKYSKNGDFRADLVPPDKWPKGRSVGACCTRIRSVHLVPTKGVDAARSMETARPTLEVMSFCWGLITKTTKR